MQWRSIRLTKAMASVITDQQFEEALRRSIGVQDGPDVGSTEFRAAAARFNALVAETITDMVREYRKEVPYQPATRKVES